MTGYPFERLSYDLDYDQALSYLYGLQKFGIKFGLSSTQNLLDKFDNPQNDLALIHIAGSNGKGSVAALADSVYSQAGYRVGLFTSPHLVDFRERFRISGQMISKEKTLDLVKEIRERCDPDEPPTFFEFVTVMALIHFKREKVNLAILEVGLGGRLDATNIIHPLVSVITSISLEHQEYLGNTLKKVALEKAGIIKEKVPLITGVTQKGVQETFRQVCLEKEAPMLLAGRDFRTRKTGQGEFTYFGFSISGFGFKQLKPMSPDSQSTSPNLKLKTDQAPITSNSQPQTPDSGVPQSAIRNPKFKLGLLGDHQIRNAGLALTVVETLKNRFPVREEEIRQGLSRVTWPGRLEVLSHNPWIVLDGAHNPGAMSVLARNLPRVFSYNRLLLVFGMMKDKEIGKTFNRILPLADRVYLTRAEYDRSADPGTLVPFVEREGRPYYISQTIPEAIRKAREEATEGDLILITGSLFIVGEARAWWEREGSYPFKPTVDNSRGKDQIY
jgi:dihydrofolate synthase/folylpolyglutamate synthase